jgi:branched-chain amino acid transport system ATP-binding protein
MLEIRNVGVRYGHHLALEGVSAKVEKGEICVILGANGAGKSSLLKAISGMVKVEAGSEIVMNGKTITGMKPHRIVEEGIALVPEGRGIFGDLTVGENLQLGAFAMRARNQEAATLTRIYELFPRLAERKSQVVRTMSGGEQQMVAIGRALMSKPDILMLDEPSLGLSPLLTKDLFKSLRAIAATGVGILLVEQNAKQSLKIADRGYLIENGLITGENTAAALAEDPAVVNAYLGGAAEKKPQTASRKIRLPAPFALPSTLEAMGRFMGELASRAGAIHAAFIRFVRRETSVPSAFVGRYDPKAGGDPFDGIDTPQQTTIQRSRPMVSSDALNLSTDAGRLAHAAGERLARHVRSQRLSGPRPSAFAHAPREEAAEPGEPDPARPAAAPASLDPSELARRAGERFSGHIRAQRDGGRSANAQQPIPADRPQAVDAQGDGPADRLDIAALTKRATERLAEHVRRQREAAGLTAKPTPARQPEKSEEARPPNGADPSPLLGHNSAGFDIEDEDERQARPSGALDFASLAERAAAIHAAHLAASRKKLTVQSFAVSRQGENSEKTD